MKIIFLLIFFGQVHFSLGQDIIIRVKRGKAICKGVEWGNKDGNKILKISDELIIAAGSLVMAGNGSSVIELTESKKYKGSDISNALKKNSVSFSKAFYDVIFNIPSGNDKRESGAVMRGANDAEDALSYTPTDSVQVISKVFSLTIGNHRTHLDGKVQLIHLETGKTVTYSPESRVISLSDLAPGTYTWEYNISTDFNPGTIFQYRNIFLIPDELKRTQLSSAYDNFLKTISSFSDSVREVLIREYQEINMVFVGGPQK